MGKDMALLANKQTVSSFFQVSDTVVKNEKNNFMIPTRRLEFVAKQAKACDAKL